MCPACMASAAVVAGSVMSSGGIAALAVKLVRGKKIEPRDQSTNSVERSENDGDRDNR